MKDLETLLKQSGGAKPRRGLHKDFTKNITELIAHNPRKKGVWRIAEVLNMKFFTKPAIAVTALVLTVVIGGAAYAGVAGWPSIVALFGGRTELGNGYHIVKVDTKNCAMTTAFNVTQKDKTQNEYYYKVKNSSKLTDRQVVEMVLGNCYNQQQADFDEKFINDTLNANPLNKNRVVGGYIDSVVTAISSSSISIESAWPMNREVKTIKQTFNHIAPDVFVYQSPNKLNLSDVHVGDHVSIKYRASGDALAHSETISPDQVNASEQVVVMINKNTPQETDAINYEKYNGSDFEQVAPCSNDPSGYCNAEQYNK